MESVFKRIILFAGICTVLFIFRSAMYDKYVYNYDPPSGVSNKQTLNIDRILYTKHFNIDSLKMEMLKDTTYRIKKIVLNKTDSMMKIVVKESEYLRDEIKGKLYFNEFLRKYKFEYATNIIAIGIFGTKNPEDLIWTYVKPGSNLERLINNAEK